jgi:hypothetical protein
MWSGKARVRAEAAICGTEGLLDGLEMAPFLR